MDKITTTLKREPFREIVARRKRVEYRELKPYWVARLQRVGRPFLLRLINGMQADAPELTVVVTGVRKYTRRGYFALQLGRIVEVKNWDRRREAPAVTQKQARRAGARR